MTDVCSEEATARILPTCTTPLVANLGPRPIIHVERQIPPDSVVEIVAIGLYRRLLMPRVRGI